MSVEELNSKLNGWNPMENDYKNTKFNHYVSGPGAELEAELQPGQQALQNGEGNKTGGKIFPTLVFRHLPIDMTKTAMHNICSRHGKVVSVRDSTKNDYYFVELATVADMEAVFRALEKNSYGFQVLVGKNNKKTSAIEKNIFNRNLAPVPPLSTGIDYQNRTYRTSNKQHPRPKVNEDSLLNTNSPTAVDTGLPLKLLSDDAHSLERQGLYKMPNNNKFNYRNGRSYVKLPKKTKEFIDKKHSESSGAYNDSSNGFKHTPKQSLMPTNFSKCSVCFYACDTVCARCSQYYCSVKCQLSDWPQHCYKCGKPEHLQKTPSHKKQNKCDKKSPENSNKTNKEAFNCNENKDNQTNSHQQLPSCSNSSKNKPKMPTTTKLEIHSYPNSSATSIKKQPITVKQQQKELSICSKSSATSIKKQSITVKPQQIKLPSCSTTSIRKLPTIAKQQEQPSGSKTSSNVSKIPAATNSDQQNMPRSGNIVTITAISKTNVVFIRSKTYDANLRYFNTMDSLQAIGKMLQPLKSMPECGHMVIAKFEEQYNRALVLQVINSERILIIFVDYGNLEQLKLDDLYKAPAEFVAKPRHAIPVILKDVPDLHMTQEVRKFMYTYLDNINVEIRYKEEDFLEESKIYAVELIDESTQQNLNKMIIKLSKPSEPQNTNEICNRGYLEQKVLPSGDNVELFVMDNSLMSSGCASCTIKPYAIEIQKFQKELQAYAESIPQEGYTPRVDELCIVRYSLDGLWYRGLCLEAVGDGHPSIHFIDYGNITIVPIEDIRRYPRQFTYPIYTADCEIKGLPQECDDKLVAKLEQLIPNHGVIECENVTAFEGENFYIITLPDVIRELIACGLLKNDQHIMEIINK